MVVVEQGSRGHYTCAVQRIIGVPASKVDGVIGPFSVEFLKQWERRQGIVGADGEGDGVFGPLCRQAVDPGDLVKPYEGLVLRAYDDIQEPYEPLPQRFIRRVGNAWRRLDGTPIRGYPTIGYGRKLEAGEWIETCTKQQAEQWYDDALRKRFMPEVRKGLPPGDPAKDAAVASLGHNGGEGAIRDLIANHFDAVWWSSHYIRSQGKVLPGLIARRKEEAALFWGIETIV